MNRLSPFLLACLAIPVGCAPGTRSPARVANTAPQGRGWVYECAGGRVSVWMEPDSLSLWLPPRFGRPYVRLYRALSGSGARYEGDSIELWIKGYDATLHVDSTDLSPCSVNPLASVWEDAKLRGVSFRAVGNEPGWMMEITDGDRIRLLLDYGERELVLPDPGPSTDPHENPTVYRLAGDSVEVTIDIGECTDTMSDERFESSVTVVVGDRTYRGCGRPLH